MDRQNLLFNVLRNALYHTARRRSLETQNRLFNFAVIALGASAVLSVIQPIVRPEYIGIATTVIGAVQLVWDFGGKARDHAQLQRDYLELLSRIEGTIEPSAKQLAAWKGEMIRISSSEGPILRAVDAKAYNDAIDATEFYGPGERLYIGVLPRLFGAVLTFEGHRFDKLSERQQAAAE